MEDSRVDELTEREREIVRLIARNRSDAQIADLLNLSVHTVRTHIKNARGKVGGRDKYYLADALADLEGRTPSIARAIYGMAGEVPSAPDRQVSIGETAPEASDALREERSVFEHFDHLMLSEPSHLWGKNDDLRTLTIICLVLAIALLIAMTFIYAPQLSAVFQSQAAHLHQID